MEIKRVRLSIPYDDLDVIGWLENQQNLSQSIRLLIKDFVKSNGLIDAMCVSVLSDEDKEVVKTKSKRGRPKGNKETKELMKKAEDIAMTYNNKEVKLEPIVGSDFKPRVKSNDDLKHLDKFDTKNLTVEESKDDMEGLDFDSFMGDEPKKAVEEEKDINELLRMI